MAVFGANMPTEMARCFNCKRYRISDNLQLNRTTWEYECKDSIACRESVDSNPEYDGDKKRKSNTNYLRKRRKGTKVKSKESQAWNRMK